MLCARAGADGANSNFVFSGCADYDECAGEGTGHECHADAECVTLLPLAHLLTHSFIHSFVHSFVHSFIHSFIRSFIHSFIHSFVHSFIHSSMSINVVHSNRSNECSSFAHPLLHSSIALSHPVRGQPGCQSLSSVFLLYRRSLTRTRTRTDVFLLLIG